MTGRGGEWARGLLLLVALAATAAPPLRGQGLADFDYENLSFRGIGASWGYMWPNRVEPTQSFDLRMDLGYLGPGLRIVPTLGYWSSEFEPGEVRELESRVEDLVLDQSGEDVSVDLGTIEWTDVRLGLDAHVVWRIPYGVLTFAGAGASAHLLNGDGAAINGTFVEDLLDSVTAGFNLHAGLEYPVTDRFRVYGQGRYEVLGDLQYVQVRTGLQFMIGGPAPGEERAR
jgi:opacity protein-like surface antigen